MSSRIKILCCCGAGMGTCMVLRARVDKVMTKLNISASIQNESVQQGLTMYKQFDYVFCNQNLTKQFKVDDKVKTKVIGLENVTSLQEIEEKFLTARNDE